VASETTAAASGEIGIVRRDPMAMKPFCGYNFADYWGHWLKVGSQLRRAPRIFHVNWFRQNAAGKFLWPGFGDNLRVLAWMLDRCSGRVAATETPIGFLPQTGDLNTAGLDISAAALDELTAVPKQAWLREMADLRGYLSEYGSHLPAQMLREVEEIERRLEARSEG
jgi:phosphoenolpyruvate carboxykinase (GTP)